MKALQDIEPSLAQQEGRTVEKAGVPEDLRAWVDEPRLVDFVLQAVEEPNRHLPPGPVRVWLTLLTYSYGTGVYGSDEIQKRLATDPHLDYLSANVTPSSSELRQFRRHHHQRLEQSLSALMELAWVNRRLPAPELCDSREALAGWRRVEGEQIFAGAAKARIEQAVLADTISLDY